MKARRALFPILLFLPMAASCGGADPAALQAPWPPPASWVEPDRELRARLRLDGTWTFVPEGHPPRPVQVPCFWEADPAWPGYDSCPGYLAGTPDEGLQITEGQGWERRTIHRGTYLLDVSLPETAPPVAKLRFESVHHRATVFWNGREAGTHTGPYVPAAFDVSAFARPGVNALRVELADGSALLGPDGVVRWPAGYYAHTDITGLYRPVTLEMLPAVHVADTFAVPSTRRGDLTLEHTLANATDADARVWVISRAVDGQGAVGLQTRAVEVRIPARGEARAVVVEPWPDAVRWDPVSPHLYELETLLLDRRGRPVDLRRDRFGFREVWIQDGHYMLNGMRMNLVGDTVDDQASRPRYWATKYLDCEAAPETLRRIRGLHFNAVRFHQAPPPECLYDLADETGLLVIAESAVYARLDIVPPFHHDETYAANSRGWIDAWVRQNRNHPSIVLWSVENEMFMYGFGLSLEQALSLGEPARAADTVVRPDGTATTPRPVNWDGDSNFFRTFGLAPETVNWHYPAGGWLTVYPDREWYSDAIAHFAPYRVTDVPCGVGETMVVRRTAYPDRTLDMAKAMQGAAIKALRILGFSDIRPYKMNWAWHDFDPQGNEHPWAPHYHGLYSQEQKARLVEHLQQAAHPIAVFDRGYTRLGANPDGSFGPVTLPPGARVQRTLEILNDSFLPGEPQTVAWSVRDETAGRDLASGVLELAVPHGGKERRTVRFRTPDGESDLTLSIRSSMEGLPQGEFRIDYAFRVLDSKAVSDP